MTQDPASLSRLVDIVQPAPVSWWPPAIGWWFLTAFAIGVTAWFAYRGWRHWRARAYRRAALAELESARTNAAVVSLIKRTALAAFRRDQVASLSGRAWCTWLESKCKVPISDAARRALTDDVYREPAKEASRELIEFASQWIRQHGQPESGEVN